MHIHVHVHIDVHVCFPTNCVVSRLKKPYMMYHLEILRFSYLKNLEGFISQGYLMSCPEVKNFDVFSCTNTDSILYTLHMASQTYT